MPTTYGPDNVADPADQFRAPIIAPLGSPQPELGDCQDADDTVVFDTRIDPTDAIVLLVDTSGSMAEVLSVLGQSETRLAWAQSSVKQIALIVQHVNSLGGGPPQQLGLVTFATQVNALLPLSPIGTANAATANDVANLILAAPAQGVTALADGVVEAADVATATGAGSPSVIVFTDGQANVCVGGVPAVQANCSVPQANQDAVDAIDAAAAGNPGVNFYLVPLGAEFGAGLFGKSAGAPGDLMLAETGFELPIAMLEAYLRATGRSPITPRTTWAVAGTSGRPRDLRPEQAFEVLVERDAGALHVSLTSLNADLSTFAPVISLRRPDGTLVAAADFLVEEDFDYNIYRTVLVEDPEPGRWTIELASQTEEPQYGYALAWTDSREADCYAGTASPLLNATVTEQEVHATASWGTPIEGVSYQGTLTKPDGTVQTLAPVAEIEDNGMARAWIGAVDYQGLYRVEVRCDAQHARFARGEQLLPDDPSDPLADDSVPAFVRTATTTFVVDNGRFQPLPAGDDCDGDGISNADEGAWCMATGVTTPCEPAPTSRDSDSDGILDACDEDSDGDEILDRDEPPGDLDGDGLANVIDPDSDGDGILDGLDDEPYLLRAPRTRCLDSGGTLLRASAAVLDGDYQAAADLTRESMLVTGRLLTELASTNPATNALTTALQLQSLALTITTSLAPEPTGSTGGYIGHALQTSLAAASLTTAAMLTSCACAGI